MSRNQNGSSWPLVASLLAMAVAVPVAFSAAPAGPAAGAGDAAAAPAGGRGGGAGGARGGRGAAAHPAYIEEGYDDHPAMMAQLGITALRPGKSGSNQTGPGFELETANHWMSSMPDVMKMKDGTKVTTAAQWPKRRAEILEDFEREVYGRIPANVPKVTWEVTATTEGESGGIPTVTKTLVGHVDNSGFPEITVNIQGSFTVPKNAAGPVPIMIEFGGGGGGGGFGGGGPARGGAAPAGPGGAAPAAPGAPARGGAMGVTVGEEFFVAAGAPAAPDAAGAGGGRRGGRGRGGAPGASGAPDAAAGPGAAGGGRGPAGPSWTQLAIQHGWGYGYMNPSSVQADSGGFALRQGIIGLTNKGKARKPDDWGSLRAWQWGVSKMIDYFEANGDSKVDPKKVGIEGVSRYGKAALVTEAFEPRIAVALVASSGEGGAKLHRHDYGEAVENLTATGEYHWMAGNFLKYGAKESKFGEMDASNLPVDSHELIALCAPRPCFISYGVERNGDPKWVGAAGSWMATIGAGPVYRLLGKKDLGVGDDYLKTPMPAEDTLVGNDLAWRQHSQSPGHSAGGNYPTFFEWVGAYIKSPAAAK